VVPLSSLGSAASLVSLGSVGSAESLLSLGSAASLVSLGSAPAGSSSLQQPVTKELQRVRLARKIKFLRRVSMLILFKSKRCPKLPNLTLVFKQHFLSCEAYALTEY
jgi:hypothetical protein